MAQLDRFEAADKVLEIAKTLNSKRATMSYSSEKRGQHPIVERVMRPAPGRFWASEIYQEPKYNLTESEVCGALGILCSHKEIGSEVRSSGVWYYVIENKKNRGGETR